MTILTPPTPAAPAPPLPPLQGDAFFPTIDLARFTAEMRLAGQVTPDRARNALVEAMIDVEADAGLIAQVAAWRAAGHESLTDVPATLFGGEHKLAFLYRRAVFSFAKAALDETYRDNAMTSEGEDRARGVDVVVGSHLRNARNALSDLVGRSHATIELL